MDWNLQRFFLLEISLQARFVELGSEALDRALADETSVGTTDIWLALQTIVVSSANLSKMLWGSSGKKAAERAEIRDSLGLKDDSCLNSVDLRNDFEHIDERMERFAKEGGSHFVIGRNVGGPPHAWGDTKAGNRSFGHYDPDSGLVWFWENDLSVPCLVAEAGKIRPVAWEMATAPRRP
jgi:hypothetical protein